MFCRCPCICPWRECHPFAVRLSFAFIFASRSVGGACCFSLPVFLFRLALYARRPPPPPVSSILILPSSFLLADAVDDIRLAPSSVNTIRTEVDLTLCPDYLEVCPQLMDLGTVERKLGRPNDSNREYLYHSEFIRDMRLIYANSIAYNNPDTVINELDRVRETAVVLSITPCRVVRHTTLSML